MAKFYPSAQLRTRGFYVAYKSQLILYIYVQVGYVLLYYSVPKKQLGWLSLSHSPFTNTTTASNCITQSGQIPGDKPQQGIDLYDITDSHVAAQFKANALNEADALINRVPSRQ